MNIVELVKAAHARSVENGFWDPPVGPDLVMVRVALIHSEISEALEEWRSPTEKRGGPLGAIQYELGNGKRCAIEGCHERYVDNFQMGAAGNLHKPVGFVVELADVAIRLFDLIGFLQSGEGAPIEEMANGVQEHFVGSCAHHHNDAPAGATFCHLHALTMRIGECIEEDSMLSAAQLPRYCAGLLRLLGNVAALYSGNLEEAITIKMAFNKTREFRHGKTV